MPDDKPPVSTGSSSEAPQGAITAAPMAVPPIPLGTTKTLPAAAPQAAPKPPENKDTFRELIETIVFVVVLVLMLKTFLAEAFVIPTGSMADTLLGYHHKFVCVECGKTNLVNASSEADPQEGPPAEVVEWRCENCQFWNRRR